MTTLGKCTYVELTPWLPFMSEGVRVYLLHPNHSEIDQKPSPYKRVSETSCPSNPSYVTDRRSWFVLLSPKKYTNIFNYKFLESLNTKEIVVTERDFNICRRIFTFRELVCHI